jgi:hypothetical protein
MVQEMGRWSGLLFALEEGRTDDENLVVSIMVEYRRQASVGFKAASY